MLVFIAMSYLYTIALFLFLKWEIIHLFKNLCSKKAIEAKHYVEYIKNNSVTRKLIRLQRENTIK